MTALMRYNISFVVVGLQCMINGYGDAGMRICISRATNQPGRGNCRQRRGEQGMQLREKQRADGNLGPNASRSSPIFGQTQTSFPKRRSY